MDIIRFRPLLKDHSEVKQEHIFTADIILHRRLRQNTDHKHQHFSYFADSLLPTLTYHFNSNDIIFVSLNLLLIYYSPVNK